MKLNEEFFKLNEHLLYDKSHTYTSKGMDKLSKLLKIHERPITADEFVSAYNYTNIHKTINKRF